MLHVQLDFCFFFLWRTREKRLCYDWC